MELSGRQSQTGYRGYAELDMNCIPALQRLLLRLLPIAAFMFTSACGISTSESAEADPSASAEADPSASAEEDPGASRVYQLEYIVTPDPQANGAWVEMKLRQSANLLREVDMRAPAERISNPGGDGEFLLADERLIWHPPVRGGSLRWFAAIDHQRESGSYDAYITTDWAIFRAEDVIPQAATRTLRGATSETTLSFDLPAGWSSLTEYFGREHSYSVRNTNRRFDRPAGWIILGDIGVRYDRVAGVRVNVAAPTNQGMRRTDILAMLNWTLPEVLRTVPEFPKRLTIIGAGDPMWRGGLSGPRSLFVHADRPLISENGTSTLLHEVMHIALGGGADEGMDWIVEGLAEYYSLTILQRSGTITDKRYEDALRKQSEWGATAADLCASRSSGAITARAVTIMSALDQEIRTKSKGRKSIDDVISALATMDEPISIAGLSDIVRKVSGHYADTLVADNLPGCKS